LCGRSDHSTLTLEFGDKIFISFFIIFFYNKYTKFLLDERQIKLQILYSIISYKIDQLEDEKEENQDQTSQKIFNSVNNTFFIVHKIFDLAIKNFMIEELNTKENGSIENQALNFSNKIIDFLYDDKIIDESSIEKLISYKSKMPSELQEKISEKFTSLVKNNEGIPIDTQILMLTF
jgi:hypothetical protein